MGGPYRCPVGWAFWAPVEKNTTIKTYLEEDLVTTTNSNRIIISFYLWLLFYSIKNSDVFFEGAISNKVIQILIHISEWEKTALSRMGQGVQHT